MFTNLRAPQVIIRDKNEYPIEIARRTLGQFADLDVEVLRLLNNAGVIVCAP